MKPTKFTTEFVAAFNAGTLDRSDRERLSPEDVLAIRSSTHQVRYMGADSMLRAAGDGGDSFAFVMSTERPVGWSKDIVRANGWELTDFVKRGQPWLYDHNMSFDRDTTPLGSWSNVRTARAHGSRSLVGDAMPVRGLDPFKDMIFRLIELRVLPGVSVGFDPLEVAIIEDPAEQVELGLGPCSVIFVRANLVECSSTAIPMDPDATLLRSEQSAQIERVLAEGVRSGEFTPEAAREFRVRSLGLGAKPTIIMPPETTPFGAGITPAPAHAPAAPAPTAADARLAALERRLDQLAVRSAEPAPVAAPAASTAPAPASAPAAESTDVSELRGRVAALEARNAELDALVRTAAARTDAVYSALQLQAPSGQTDAEVARKRAEDMAATRAIIGVDDSVSDERVAELVLALD